ARSVSHRAKSSSSSLFFLFQASAHHRDLPSFPTRRSSDLVETLVARGAEAAIDGAAGLAGHAQRAAVVFGNEDGLDGIALAHVEQPLARAIGGALLGVDRRRLDAAALRKLAAEVAGQVGHGVERVGAALVDPALQLAGAKRLAAPLPDQVG